MRQYSVEALRRSPKRHRIPLGVVLDDLRRTRCERNPSSAWSRRTQSVGPAHTSRGSSSRSARTGPSSAGGCAPTWRSYRVVSAMIRRYPTLCIASASVLGNLPPGDTRRSLLEHAPAPTPYLDLPCVAVHLCGCKLPRTPPRTLWATVTRFCRYLGRGAAQDLDFNVRWTGPRDLTITNSSATMVASPSGLAIARRVAGRNLHGPRWCPCRTLTTVSSIGEIVQHRVSPGVYGHGDGGHPESDSYDIFRV